MINDDIIQLGMVKKYKYNKNFAIFLVCNLPIAVLGGILLAILWFAQDMSSLNRLGIGDLYYVLIVGVAIACIGVLVWFVLSLYMARRKREKEFNDKTPTHYISYDSAKGEFTILRRKYSVEDIEDVQMVYVRENDILHMCTCESEDNGINKERQIVDVSNMSTVVKINARESAKKTNVGNIQLVLKSGKYLYLQRVLDVDYVYDKLKEILRKN